MTESGEPPKTARAAAPGTAGDASVDAAAASPVDQDRDRSVDVTRGPSADPDRGASTDVDRDALDCIVLVELVTEYLEEALDPDRRRRVERHLGECPGCSVYIEQMRMTIQAAGRLAPADVPREAIAPLLAAFRASARSTTE